jgi:hypothetical protein
MDHSPLSGKRDGFGVVVEKELFQERIIPVPQSVSLMIRRDRREG